MTAIQHEPAIQQEPATKPPLGVARKTPMQWFTNGCVRYVERLMPDPYLFAVILTLLVIALIFFLVPDATAGGIVDSWYEGVWGKNNIFTFAMQMVLILVSGYTLAEAPAIKRALAGRPSFAERLEGLWILNVIFFLACATFFVRSGFAMNIASMVMLFTGLAALLHGTPTRFIRSFTTAAKTSGPLLLQYPLYGGIVGLLAYAPTTGIRPLQAVIAASIVSGATMYTLPFLNYVASVLITLFVPSGGGHWAVQGPVAVSTAMQLGQTSPAYLGKISMSVASGEAVANMIQPFWLLPVLAIAKLNVRQVMGFTVAAFILGFVVFGVAALVMPLV